MTRISLLCALVVLALSGSAVLAQGEVALRYKFEKNKPLKYRLNMASKAEFTMPDNNVQNLNMKTYIELTQELIEAKADGSFRIAVSIDKATQVVNGQNSPLQNMPPTLVTMLPNGEIVDAAAASSAPGAQQLQMIFPQKALKEGESWEQEQNIQQPLPLTTKTIYTLAQRSAPFPGYPKAVALIKNQMNLENSTTETGETVTSETRGNLWFDVERGCIVRSKAHSDFSFDLPINIPGMLPEGATVKVKMQLQIEISLAD